MTNLYAEIISHIKELYPQEVVSLHEPRLGEREKELLSKCIDSTFVSSVGEYVGQFETEISRFTGHKFAIATVNGTAALHLSLIMGNVQREDEVLTQTLTFIATANAISYCSAKPVFVDSASGTLGMCPEKLEQFLRNNTVRKDDGLTYNKKTGAVIRACVPMHVFGHPCQMNEIARLCTEYNIFLIEDAAEALGSFQEGKHVGHHGKLSVLSFNGNKIITSGGGGMILTNDESLARKAKHLSTTAKVPHQWEFVHDQVGYNYRLPNLNAALGCAQLEKLPAFLENKRVTAEEYRRRFSHLPVQFFSEPTGSTSNYWLNSVLFPDQKSRDEFLEYSNSKKIMTRPLWKMMHELEMYKDCERTDLSVAGNFYKCLVNIPSSVRIA